MSFNAPHLHTDDGQFKPENKMSEHLEAWAYDAAIRRRELDPRLKALTAFTDKIALRGSQMEG